MKVLYLNPMGAMGGAEKVLVSVIEGVRRCCPEGRLHLLSLAPGALLEHASRAGADVSVLPLSAALAALGDSQFAGARNRTLSALSALKHAVRSGSAVWRFVDEFTRAINRIKPDLIHSNGIKTHVLSWLAGMTDTPVVWHVHDFYSARPLACRLLRTASRRVAAAIAISPAVAADLRALGLRERTDVVPNAVDVLEYSPARQDGALLDQLAGLPPAPQDCLRVGMIASYARWKGQEVFLKAVAQAVTLCPNVAVRFYIVGGQIYQTRGSQFDKHELQRLASSLGIADRVGFIDFQASVAPIYRALDIVVHASTAPEPFGLTIVEAMACGKAVIATLAGGVRDIIRHGHDALGVPPGDAAALTAAVRLLLDNEALRRALGQQARQAVCQKFNQDRIGPQVLAVYRNVLAQRRPTPAARNVVLWAS